MKIPNGVLRDELAVTSIITKLREGRVRWFGHVKRRFQTTPIRRAESVIVSGTRDEDTQ